MNIVYCLRMHVLEHNFPKISRTLNLVNNDKYGWAYSFNHTDTDYVKLLDNVITNFSKLNKIENLSEKVEFWIYYEYEQQCNLELEPLLLQKLGKIGSTLCVSCWDKNSNNVNSSSTI